MANYAHKTKNTTPNYGTGGYKNELLFCPLADFTLLQAPAPGGTPAIGDYVTIPTAHTFGTGKGFYGWAAKVHSVTGKGKTVGDDGAKEMEYEYEATFIGDDAATQEQVTRMLNDDVIILLKDGACGANAYIQLGDACVLPTFDGEQDGKTTKEGKKEWKIKMTCKARYFYTAAVTKAV